MALVCLIFDDAAGIKTVYLVPIILSEEKVFSKKIIIIKKNYCLSCSKGTIYKWVHSAGENYDYIFWKLQYFFPSSLMSESYNIYCKKKNHN